MSEIVDPSIVIEALEESQQLQRKIEENKRMRIEREYRYEKQQQQKTADLEAFDPATVLTDPKKQSDFLRRFVRDLKETVVWASTAPVFIHPEFKKHFLLGKHELVVIGAVSGQGKSIAMVNIAINLLQQGRNVLWFTNEMSADSLTRWLGCSMAGIDHRLVIQESQKFESVEALKQIIAPVQEFILNGQLVVKDSNDDQVACSAERLLKTIRAANKRDMFKPDIILIDYLGHIKSELNPQASEYEQQAPFLKELAHVANLSCPIVIAQQMHPKSGGRESAQGRMYQGQLLFQAATTLMEVAADKDKHQTTFTFHKVREGVGGSLTMGYLRGRYVTLDDPNYLQAGAQAINNALAPEEKADDDNSTIDQQLSDLPSKS